MKSKRKRKWDCVFCDKSFSCYSAIARHIQSHTKEKPFFCQICGASYSQKNNLDSHLVARHSNVDSIKNLIKNKKSHKCSSCGKFFLSGYSLNLHHQRRHTAAKDLRTFKCDLCPATFAFSDYLQRHLKRHEVNNVTCDICHEAMLWSMLGTHQLQCHPLDYYRNHKNNVVRQRRNQKQTRNNKKDHNNEGGQESKRQDLPRLKSSRSMPLTFLCSICDATFRNEAELNEHKKNHFEATLDLSNLDQEDDDPDKKKKQKRRKKIKFKCAFCPARFRGMERLEKHFMKVHKGNVTLDDEDDNIENEGTLKSTAEKKTRRIKRTRTINSLVDIPMPMPTLVLVNHY